MFHYYTVARDTNIIASLTPNENGENRTLDLQIKSLLLFQLSYIPEYSTGFEPVYNGLQPFA